MVSLLSRSSVSMTECLRTASEDVAAQYDGGPMFDPEVLGPTVDLLAELAGDGEALEFAIRTGRVAIPFTDRGRRGVGNRALHRHG